MGKTILWAAPLALAFQFGCSNAGAWLGESGCDAVGDRPRSCLPETYGEAVCERDQGMARVVNGELSVALDPDLSPAFAAALEEAALLVPGVERARVFAAEPSDPIDDRSLFVTACGAPEPGLASVGMRGSGVDVYQPDRLLDDPALLANALSIALYGSSRQ